ncbi:MAG: protein translocase subunit SecF [Actinomycetota bacterium]|nr:protein translocase subunit SecF [Actinomycetota bacterium]
MKFRNFYFDFVGKRKIWFIISLVVILAGLAGFLIRGASLNLGIDFLGGSLIEVEFSRDTNTSEIRNVISEVGLENAIIQQNEFQLGESNRFIIRTTPINSETKERMINLLDEEIGLTGSPLQDRMVDPGFSKQITKYALIAIGISIIGILVYVWIRFEFRLGAAAILALIHDVLVTIGIYAILNREVNTSTIAAILTIIGYSINDTIVVFDRIRENTPLSGKFGYSKIINDSINTTLTRSLNTALTTLIPILLLLILGTSALRDFAMALSIGIIAGTYSSICIASPILIVWNNRFPRYKK